MVENNIVRPRNRWNAMVEILHSTLTLCGKHMTSKAVFSIFACQWKSVFNMFRTVVATISALLTPKA
jgi:hypothetical protein